MNCREAEKQIEDFMEDNLSVREVRAFIDHIRKCDSCRDEAEVRMFASVIADPDAGEDLRTYDLNDILDRKIRSVRQWILKVQVITAAAWVLNLALIGLLVYLVISG